MADFLPPEFKDFLEPSCDRAKFIEDWLAARGIGTSTLVIDGNRHILVRLREECYSKECRTKTLLAHYDRAESSPGANDNSAAVFQLLFLARRLMQTAQVHNVHILFTDSEEGRHLGEQGIFKIAQRFKALGVSSDIYILDCCGRGDSIVLSTAGASAKSSRTFFEHFNAFFDRTEFSLKSRFRDNFFSLPVPYSDNAAFSAIGIPSVAITVLPYEEAERLQRQVRFRRVSQRDMDLSDAASRKLLPKTWQLIHSREDGIESLSERAFEMMAQLLDGVSRTNYRVRR